MKTKNLREKIETCYDHLTYLKVIEDTEKIIGDLRQKDEVKEIRVRTSLGINKPFGYNFIKICCASS